MKNIKNLKDVLDVLFKGGYEINTINSKINCIYVPYYDDETEEYSTLKCYYNIATGAIIENYEKRIEIKNKIKELQDELKEMQELDDIDE